MLKEIDHKLSLYMVSSKKFEDIIDGLKEVAKLGDIRSSTVIYSDSKNIFYGTIMFKPSRIIKRKE